MRSDDFCELGVVKTATPCSADWDEMEGTDVRRFCAKCRLNVYDFSAMTTEEARRLIIETEGRLCARIFTRADGTVLTKDCPVGVTRRRRKKAGALAAAAALAGAAAVSALSAPDDACEVDDGVAEGAGKRVAPPQAPLQSGNEPGRMIAGKIVANPKKKTKL